METLGKRMADGRYEMSAVIAACVIVGVERPRVSCRAAARSASLPGHRLAVRGCRKAPAAPCQLQAVVRRQQESSVR